METNGNKPTDIPVHPRFAVRRQGVLAERQQLERLEEQRIEPLLFECTKRSNMWSASTVKPGMFEKRFDPPLLVEESNAMVRSLQQHGIIETGDVVQSEQTYVLGSSIESKIPGLVTCLYVPEAAFKKIREDMKAPTILRDHPDEIYHWMEHKRDIPGGSSIVFYAKTFHEKLANKQSNGKTINTPLGQLIEDTLTHMGLTRGQDYDWDQGHGIAVSSKAYVNVIAPALAALSKSAPENQRG